MRTFISILLLLAASYSHAQYFYNAKLLLVNGETLEGKVTLPQNAIYNKPLKIKEKGNDIVVTLECDSVYQIIYSLNNGNNYLFERHNKGITPIPFKKQRIDPLAEKEWFLVTLSHPQIKAYISAQLFYANHRGELTTHSYEGRNINFGTSYFLKRPNEKAPFLISMYSLSNSKFRKWAVNYFKKFPDLGVRIKNKEFKNYEVDKLALAYISSEK